VVVALRYIKDKLLKLSDIQIPEDKLQCRYSRSSGPGG